MKKVYIALSLTHVRGEDERDEIRRFFSWFERTFEDVELLKWAFDLETWTGKKVDNIFEFDGGRIRAADLVIFLYLTSEGSDGRGGEVVLCWQNQKPVIAFKKAGVKVSQFPVHCLKKQGVDVTEISNLADTEPFIRAALEKIREPEVALA